VPLWRNLPVRLGLYPYLKGPSHLTVSKRPSSTACGFTAFPKISTVRAFAPWTILYFTKFATQAGLDVLQEDDGRKTERVIKYHSNPCKAWTSNCTSSERRTVRKAAATTEAYDIGPCKLGRPTANPSKDPTVKEAFAIFTIFSTEGRTPDLPESAFSITLWSEKLSPQQQNLSIHHLSEPGKLGRPTYLRARPSGWWASPHRTLSHCRLRSPRCLTGPPGCGARCAAASPSRHSRDAGSNMRDWS
jgi:hypothetical protein